MNDSSPTDIPVIRFTSHRRTITETDIVNFVNVAALHEPFFIDMEYIRDNLAEGHRSRFAPGPMIISLGMGLVSTLIKDVIDRALEGQDAGAFGGMTGVSARLGAALFPNDTIHVEAQAQCRPKTRRGYTLLDIRHRVINQRGEQVADFTETVCFLPRQPLA
ncbi:MaoC family dehydratase [Algiphilus sp. W345]|uniref:MaoC family dehydratase n=1 Tax=Banduia mediterranea TaxID=3075609 RepID=A0ABU2WE42_9GAMM|nr:MaoC family dehydratase [Algiphilus sp. W345]MDT0496142.1 MaoC family dehydratase [Algiphilus sp. W345]